MIVSYAYTIHDDIAVAHRFSVLGRRVAIFDHWENVGRFERIRNVGILWACRMADGDDSSRPSQNFTRLNVAD